MGQRISSSRLTSLMSPNQHPPPCAHTHTHPWSSSRRLSLGSLEDTPSRSLSCLRGHPESARQAYLHTAHNATAHYSCRLQRSKSQDRESTHSIMASQQHCSCNTLCANCGNSRQLLEDAQNGNTDTATSSNTCVKSSSIERYMSALTERIGQPLLGGCECKSYAEPSASTSTSTSIFNANPCVCVSSGAFKARTKGRSKLVASKSCSKQLDSASTTQDCFSCVRDGPKERVAGKTSLKKKHWVSKFYGSKLTKNGAKISVNGAGSCTDSGLDIAGSTNDPSCVCTLYRKMDETCSGGTKSNCVGRSVCNVSNSGGTSNTRHECEAVRCSTNISRSSSTDLPTLSLASLPINITVSRVGQPVYSAFLTAGSATNPVYGTLTHNATSNIYGLDGNSILLSVGTQNTPLIDLRLSAEEYPVEDCEERARVRRAWEIAEGVDPPPGFRPHPHIQVLSTNELRTLILQRQYRIHTQVDFIHCLVPDLKAINQCSFYWGKMDRYEAERLLEGKPEGTFLLRDSAQEDYLFSVSFRKYGRSLHARIEQFNHKFSFDSHDPGVFAADTVTGLIEHYKDPACVMFFEPMLTAPLSRTHAFPLQHLCRAVIASCTTYDGINELRLPQSMKAYLKEYHYRQRVRVKRFEEPPEGFHWAPEEAL